MAGEATPAELYVRKTRQAFVVAKKSALAILLVAVLLSGLCAWNLLQADSDKTRAAATYAPAEAAIAQAVADQKIASDRLHTAVAQLTKANQAWDDVRLSLYDVENRQAVEWAAEDARDVYVNTQAKAKVADDAVDNAVAEGIVAHAQVLMAEDKYRDAWRLLMWLAAVSSTILLLSIVTTFLLSMSAAKASAMVDLARQRGAVEA